MNRRLKAWIEAMRLRTLPVSTAGVISAWALAYHIVEIRWLPAILCLIFAVLCQIASNFANEYYDFKDGLDKPGREGPRRGVTEGDIRPGAMRNATLIVLAIACLIGLSLIYWGGWWLIAVGVAVVIGALFYSTGPYPLSRNGLGEIAVILFFGLVPVNFTFYLISGIWSWRALVLSLAIGLMGANVLIVNNYRDADEDKLVGKRTLANIIGRKGTRTIYLINGIIAGGMGLLAVWSFKCAWIAPAVYFVIHIILWQKVNLKKGMSPKQLNPFLGMTACLMLLFSVLLYL